MSEYHGFSRTNYFAVTNEEEFIKIINSCKTTGESIELFSKLKNNKKVFAFGCHSSLSGIPQKSSAEDDTPEGDLSLFYTRLQQVLYDGHAIIITEVGYEKICYVVGECTIITPTEIYGFNLKDAALKKAREMLNNTEYNPQMDY